MQALKAKATVAGRSYEIVLAARDETFEGLQRWAAQLIRERHAVDAAPDSIRIYEA